MNSRITTVVKSHLILGIEENSPYFYSHTQDVAYFFKMSSIETQILFKEHENTPFLLWLTLGYSLFSSRKKISWLHFLNVHTNIVVRVLSESLQRHYLIWPLWSSNKVVMASMVIPVFRVKNWSSEWLDVNQVVFFKIYFSLPLNNAIAEHYFLHHSS